MKNLIVMTVMTAIMLASLLLMQGSAENLSVLSQFAGYAFVITLGTFTFFSVVALWSGRVGPVIRNNLSLGVYALTISAGLYFVTAWLLIPFYLSLVVATLVPTVIEIEVQRSAYTPRRSAWFHLSFFGFFAAQALYVAVAFLQGDLYTAVAVTLLPVAAIFIALLLRRRDARLMRSTFTQ